MDVTTKLKQVGIFVDNDGLRAASEQAAIRFFKPIIYAIDVVHDTAEITPKRFD